MVERVTTDRINAKKIKIERCSRNTVNEQGWTGEKQKLGQEGGVSSSTVVVS